MEHLETEVKFFLTSIESVRNRILDLGAAPKGRVFETNIRFEDTNKSLIQKKSLLRLRRDTKTTLTFKSEPAAADEHFSIYRELEVEVSDFATTCHILECLGYRREQIYEKWRESFEFRDTRFCIDTMPYGDFLEIEGKKRDIENLAFQIGMEWGKRILLNYLEIFDIIRQRLNLRFSDVTFDNFSAVGVDLTAYLHLLEAQSL